MSPCTDDIKVGAANTLYSTSRIKTPALFIFLLTLTANSGSLASLQLKPFMSIQKTKAFTTSDNQVFTTIELAQQHELGIIVQEIFPKSSDNNEMFETLTAGMIERKDRIADILTLKSTSRAARKPKKTKDVKSKDTKNAQAANVKAPNIGPADPENK